jgi:hypothetical protein
VAFGLEIVFSALLSAWVPRPLRKIWRAHRAAFFQAANEKMAKAAAPLTRGAVQKCLARNLNVEESRRFKIKKVKTMVRIQMGNVIEEYTKIFQRRLC